MQAVEAAGYLKRGTNLFLVGGDVQYSYSVMLKVLSKVKPDLKICRYESAAELHSAISSDPGFFGEFRAHIFFGLDSGNVEDINA